MPLGAVVLSRELDIDCIWLPGAVSDVSRDDWIGATLDDIVAERLRFTLVEGEPICMGFRLDPGRFSGGREVLMGWAVTIPLTVAIDTICGELETTTFGLGAWRGPERASSVKGFDVCSRLLLGVPPPLTDGDTLLGPAGLMVCLGLKVVAKASMPILVGAVTWRVEPS